VWQGAKRRPPKIYSDQEYNRFSIELDSRPLKIIASSFWRERLGITVTIEEGKILGLLGNYIQGLSLIEICTATGENQEEVLRICELFARMALLEYGENKYSLKPHLLELAKEAEA
jgi:hypothetical protein